MTDLAADFSLECCRSALLTSSLAFYVCIMRCFHCVPALVSFALVSDGIAVICGVFPVLGVSSEIEDPSFIVLCAVACYGARYHFQLTPEDVE